MSNFLPNRRRKLIFIKTTNEHYESRNKAGELWSFQHIPYATARSAGRLTRRANLLSCIPNLKPSYVESRHANPNLKRQITSNLLNSNVRFPPQNPDKLLFCSKCVNVYTLMSRQ